MSITLGEVTPYVPEDPVHERDGKWHFYDETWYYTHGPYGTEAAARAALSDYADSIDREYENGKRT